MQMISPGIYVFHEVSFFNAMKSPGMMIGASELPLLKHIKSKSPAIGKDIGITQPVVAIQQQLGIRSKSTVYRLLRINGIEPSRR